MSIVITEKQFHSIQQVMTAKYKLDDRYEYFGECLDVEKDALRKAGAYSLRPDITLQHSTDESVKPYFSVTITPLKDAIVFERSDRNIHTWAIAYVTHTQVCELTSKRIPQHRTYYLTEKMWDEIKGIVDSIEEEQEIDILPDDFLNHGYKEADPRLPPYKKHSFRKSFRDEEGVQYVIDVETHDFSDKSKYPGSPKKYIYTLKASLNQPDNLENFQASFTIGMSQNPYSIARIEESIKKLWTSLNCQHTSPN